MNKESLKFGIESWNWANARNIGGVERYVLRLTDNLTERGVKTAIYTGPNYLDFAGTAGKVRAVDVRYPVYYHQDAGHMVTSLEKDIRSGQIDMVEVEGFYGIRRDFEIMRRVLKLEVPLVFVSHNTGLLYKKDLYKERGVDFARVFSDRVDAIICVSKKLASDALEFGFSQEKIQVIYNPVDEGVFHPVTEATRLSIRKELGLPLDKTIMLYVGRISPEKGSAYLMSAWPGVQRAIPNLHLVIVGGIAPEIPQELHEQFAAFKEARRIDGTASFSNGFVSDELLLAKYYQAADIFILPSESEGLGSVLVEAMYCGKPCIISEQARLTSGAGDLVVPGFNGTTFNEYTTAALIEAIRGIEVDMGQSSLLKAKSMVFGINEITDQHIKLYDQLLHGKPYSTAMVF